MKHLQELLSLAEASPDKSGLMPLSYKTGKGHKIEAYGVKGMQNKQWRKSFKDSAALEKWCDDNWPHSVGYAAPAFVHLGRRADGQRRRWDYA